MMNNQLGRRLAAGEPAIGVSNSFASPGIIELMCPGFDFVWIDAQHGEHTYRSVSDACRAADLVGCASLVRVESHDAGLICRYADLAPQALMVPMVDTPQQAEAIVQAISLRPRGTRSFGGLRAAVRLGSDYVNQLPLTVVQIETTQAVAAAAEIAAVDGVDALFFGGDDVRMSHGIPLSETYDNPTLHDALAATAAASAAGKLAGCIAGSDREVERAVGLGYRLIAVGGDVGGIHAAAEQGRALRAVAEAAR